MRLYSWSLRDRERAARAYRTFACQTDFAPQDARYWEGRLQDGEEWPDALADLVRGGLWPEHAFGTANAGLVVFWHRPGLGGKEIPAGAHIGPRVPILGGWGHPHLRYWPELHPSPSWRLLDKYLRVALEGSQLDDYLSQVMVACINPVPGKTGKVDVSVNRRSTEPGGIMDMVTRLCRPRVVLLCGRAVQAVGDRYRDLHPEVQALEVPHPLKWEGHGGEKLRGDQIARQIRLALEEAERPGASL